MLSSGGDGLQIRRLQFSQSSQSTPSQVLNTAFRGCNIADSQQLSQQPASDLSMPPPSQSQSVWPGTQTAPSQSAGMLGSQDYSTPADQQFDVAPCTQGKKMRSPQQLTPKGKTKRQRSSLLAGVEQSQGPPIFSQAPREPAKDMRYSPQCTHNVFRQQAEPDAGKVARRLPTVSIYREVYKELRLLGQGNFSKVFHARNRIDGLEYAVKRSKHEVCEEALRRQWFQEIQAWAAAGAHPNVVRYHASWLEESRGGLHFYVQLEKCGPSLGQRVSVDKQPFKEAELVDILKQVAAALQHLHSLGIAHMDVKPDNVYSSEAGTYKLGDFGLATPLASNPSRVLEGDCRYLSSEVLNGDYSRLDKADMFSLGATLYQLATGTELTESGEQYQNLRKGRVRLLPGFSTGFHAMLTKLMSKDPTERPSPQKVLHDRLLSRQPVYQQLQLHPAGL